MKPLSETFIGRGAYKGFLFKQILASDKAYLYEVDVAGQLYYHVFKRKINARFGSVSYPSPEAFGYWAWNNRSLEKAMKKYYELNEEEA